VNATLSTVSVQWPPKKEGSSERRREATLLASSMSSANRRLERKDAKRLSAGSRCRTAKMLRKLPNSGEGALWGFWLVPVNMEGA